MATTTTRARRGALALAGVAVLVLGGCAGVRTEHQGKEVGESICDLRDASSAEAAKSDLADIQDDLKDARKITGNDINQDVREINDQLADLAEHAVQGNDALIGQDLSALQRNVQQAIDATSGNAQRFYQGVQQGLSSCTDG